MRTRWLIVLRDTIIIAGMAFVSLLMLEAPLLVPLVIAVGFAFCGCLSPINALPLRQRFWHLSVVASALWITSMTFSLYIMIDFQRFLHGWFPQVLHQRRFWEDVGPDLLLAGLLLFAAFFLPMFVGGGISCLINPPPKPPAPKPPEWEMPEQNGSCNA